VSGDENRRPGEHAAAGRDVGGATASAVERHRRAARNA
jgi:hypothetical protein